MLTIGKIQIYLAFPSLNPNFAAEKEKKMKKLLIQIVACVAMSFLAFGCGGDGKCHIHGTISNQYDGKRIFLKPFGGPATSENVDSVVIRDGKFEFVSDTTKMKVILLDYHFRMGVEQLLVVTEAGDLQVEIGVDSRSSGTPQNDSLQQWKVRKHIYDQQFPPMKQEVERLRKAGQTAKADSLEEQAKSIRIAFNRYSRRMAENVGAGPLRDFLSSMFPLTYKRQMPDSTYVEYDFDTHEPIGK